MTVFVITFCRNSKLLYGTTLFFRTIRVGFPNADIIVYDNGSVPDIVPQIEELSQLIGAVFRSGSETQPHWRLLELIFTMAKGPVAVVDPDTLFWDELTWDENNLELEERFQAHDVDVDRIAELDQIRIHAIRFALYINSTVPQGRPKSIALTKLEEAAMWAVKGITHA